jgi:hypothetical protein
MNIGHQNKAAIEQLYECYRRDNSCYRIKKQQFDDFITLVHRWLLEPDLPEEDRTWCQNILPKLKSAKAPLGFPGGSAIG